MRASVGAATAALSFATTLVGGATLPQAQAVTAVPAFPGAEGFGAQTPGGRGGRVIQVTTLADSGPGSLRAALEATGPRFVVFRIGGVIELDDDIDVKSPYLTVAGQTAPGDGVTVRGSAKNTTGLVDIRTHDVVIRYLRWRAGPGAEKTSELKALDVAKASNVVIDHNSFSWSVDENSTSYDETNGITFSYNIIAEALSHSVHPEGEHSRGFFMSGENSRNISAHHNLIAHNMRRNPEVNTAGTADIRNNVIYNWGTHASQFSDKNGWHGVNVVGNYFKKGPSTTGSRYEIDVYPAGPGMQLYVKGNLGPRRTSDSQPEDALVKPDGRSWLVGQPIPAAPVTTTSATQAYTDVLADSGANLPRRDAVDERIIADVTAGTGRIIDHPRDVGGWPSLTGGPAPTDTDADGIPNSWETSHDLNPNLSDSAADRDNDGYTNIEEYANALTIPSTSTPDPAPAAPAPADGTGTGSGTGTGTVAVAVSAGSDDAEEKGSTGSVNLGSSDLELVRDGTTAQTVGLRFAGLQLPQGATVTDAYLQFQADEAGSAGAQNQVTAQATDNAPTFAASTRNISSRSTTKAQVTWTPSPWLRAGERGEAQRTPSLTSVVQEVVNRPGWVSGNALALIFQGTGVRTAEAFEGTGTAVLHVTFHR